MAKFLIVLALATIATAIDHPAALGGGFGYPFGYGGVGSVSKHVSTTSVGGYPHPAVQPVPIGGVGVTKQVTTVGGYQPPVQPVPINGFGLAKPAVAAPPPVAGVTKQISTFGTTLGYPFGLGAAPAIGAFGVAPPPAVHGIKTSHVNHVTSHYGGLGIPALGNLGALGAYNLGAYNLGAYNLGAYNLGAYNLGAYNLGAHLPAAMPPAPAAYAPVAAGVTTTVNHHRLTVPAAVPAPVPAVPAVSTIPGGYYGGFVSYPQAIPQAITPTALHIPGAAIDAYKGYFAGYYPGSIGYGSSYRFFH